MTHDPIARFLASPAFGVVGASQRRHKYGNKVLRCYQQNGRAVIPVNPREAVIEGETCVASVLDLPAEVKSHLADHAAVGHGARRRGGNSQGHRECLDAAGCGE